MATTSKILTPTNQTITLPDMTERPNASVLVDGISKEADAINALNSNLGELTNDYIGSVTSNSRTKTVTFTGLSRFLLLALSGSPDRMGAWLCSIGDTGGGVLPLSAIDKVTVSLNAATLTITTAGSAAYLYMLVVEGRGNYTVS